MSRDEMSAILREVEDLQNEVADIAIRLCEIRSKLEDELIFGEGEDDDT